MLTGQDILDLGLLLLMALVFTAGFVIGEHSGMSTRKETNPFTILIIAIGAVSGMFLFFIKFMK